MVSDVDTPNTDSTRPSEHPVAPTPPDARGAGPTAFLRGWRGVRISGASALAIYAILSVCVLQGWKITGSDTFLGTGDGPLFIWFFNWWPWSILHHVNMIQSNYVWYPTGQNLTWVTSIPALGLLAAPLTLLTSPLFTYNVFSLLAPTLGAWAAFLLFRQLTGDASAALFGGYFFGFSSYEMGQLLGHLNLDTIVFIPLLVLLSVRRFQGLLSRRMFIVLLGILLALQFGVSVEVFATACFFGAVSMLVLLLCGPARDRRALWILSLEVCCASLLTLVLILPWLAFMAAGRGEIPGQFNSPLRYSSDLANFLIPTTITVLGQAVSAISDRFTGNISEQGAYLGLPALVIVGLYFVRNARRPRIRALLVLLVVVMVCSLGPHFQVNGIDTDVPLPWAIAVRLPLLKQALPSRFTLYVALLVGLVMALWLAGRAGGWRGSKRLALAGLACITVLPNPTVLGWSRLDTPPFFTARSIEANLGRHPNIMILPYGYFAPAMYWQVKSGMAFTQSGGYLGYVPKQFGIYLWPIIGELLNVTVGPHFAQDLTSFCRAHHVTAVVVAPGSPTVLANAIQGLPWQRFTSGGVKVYRVPPKGPHPGG